MGDPLISRLPCVGWCSGHWSGVRTLYVMHSGRLLCALRLWGFCLWPWLKLVGRWRPRALGVPLCISGDGVLVLVSVLSVRHWGILTGLAFRLSGTDWCPQGLAWFPSSFLLYHSQYSLIFLVTLQNCVSKLNWIELNCQIKSVSMGKQGSVLTWSDHRTLSNPGALSDLERVQNCSSSDRGTW